MLNEISSIPKDIPSGVEVQVNYFGASTTDIGLKRKINEDSLLDRADLAIWAVADGMGGHEAGEVASTRLVEALGTLPPDGTGDEIAVQINQLIQKVNLELLHLAQDCPRPRTIGSTVVVLAIRDGHYRCLWAGDSRCYLIRGREAAQLTSDHSLVDDLVRSGMIAKEDAATHPDANVITRAVGATRELLLDCVEGKVMRGDHFILAISGVTRLVTDAELRWEDRRGEKRGGDRGS